MAEEKQEKQDKKEVKNSSKGILIALSALVIILLTTLGGGAYWVYSSGILEDGSKMAHEKDKNKEFFQAEIKDLVLNITNVRGQEKLMKLSFSVKSENQNIFDEIEKNKAEIIDAVIEKISSRSSEELLTVGGKNVLKEELVDAINTIFEENQVGEERITISKILFTSFVIK